MTPYYKDDWLTVWQGDCREVMAAMEPESVHMVCTSPPYWGLRDYGTATWLGGDEGCDHAAAKRKTRYDYALDSSPIQQGSRTGTDAQVGAYLPACPTCGAVRQDSQLGLEPTPEEYVANMVAVFREVRRVLRADGTVWLNLGDSYAQAAARGGTSNGDHDGDHHNVGFRSSSRYSESATISAAAAGLKPKDLVGIPWRVAFALQADGWYLRSDIIWAKGRSFDEDGAGSVMPESVRDRPSRSHEYVFLLTKQPRYYFDADAVREAGDAGQQEHNQRYAKVYEAHTATVQAGRAQPGNVNNLGLHSRPGAGGRNIRSVWVINPQPYRGVRVQRVGDGGTDRRVSRDCPVHGDQRRRDSTAGYGERSGASDPVRSPRTDPHLAPTPLDGRAPTGRQLDAGFAPDSSGSPDRESGSAATPRSSRTHRTVLAPGTSPRESDAGTLGRRTERTSLADAPDATVDHKPASSTAGGSAAGDSPTDPSAGTPDRNACTCTYWESVSHFAVFPEALVEPCVKAGTSERGVCPECGAPWVREVERVVDFTSGSGRAGRPPSGKNGDDYEQATSGTYDVRMGPSVRSTTTGWRPGCIPTAHPGAHFQPVPATVLDPFAGSGTTGRVAQRLGRRAVLIDLSGEYLTQAMRRNQDIPLGLESA